MRACRDRCELRYKRAGRGNVKLRTIGGVSPMHRDGPGAIGGLAALPVFCPHMHPERRTHLLRIGDDMHFMPPCREGMRGPIGAHAHAALDRRELADDADSQGCTSMSRQVERSWINPLSPGAAAIAVGS